MSSGPSAPLRVLLVEDDADHAELVRRGLTGLHSPVELTVCVDAETALERLRSQGDATPHLILLDLRLPRMNGLQLLGELRAAPGLAVIPCAVLTTSEAEADVARARELHVNRYLVKPADHERFAALVADVQLYWTQGQPGQQAG